MLLYLTQPVWRDEAFAILLALKKPIEIIQLSTLEPTPPFYYLLLHFWIKIFGWSEISTRSLSLLFHLGTIYVVYLFSKQLAQKLRVTGYGLRVTAIILTALNPMLLYYAFEVRAYSLLALFSISLMYAFYTNKKKLYIIICALGLYTHYYFALNVLVQAIYILLSKKSFKNYLYIFFPFIFFLPWTPFIFKQLSTFSGTWHYPVGAQTIFSSLGSLFTGFTGTPPFIWKYQIILTFVLLFIAVYILKKARKVGLIFFLWAFAPTAIVLGISLVKPIWYNRYLIYTAIPLTILLSIFIQRIFALKKNAGRALFIFALFAIVFYNLWIAPYIAKFDYRTSADSIKGVLEKKDIVVATDPIHFFEVKYYFLDTSSKIYLYNPQEKSIPSYIGAALIKKEDIITKLPADKTVYLIDTNGTTEKISNF